MGSSPGKFTLFALAVFGGNVVLGNFFCGDFANVGVRRILDAANHLGLERLSFFRQLRDAFRIHLRDAGQSLDIA